MDYEREGRSNNFITTLFNNASRSNKVLIRYELALQHVIAAASKAQMSELKCFERSSADQLIATAAVSRCERKRSSLQTIDLVYIKDAGMSFSNAEGKNLNCASDKKRQISTAAVLLFLVACTSISNAATPAPAAYYYGMTVLNLAAETSSPNLVKIVPAGTPAKGSWQASLNFGTCPGNAFTLDVSQPNYKVMYSMLLTAYITNSPINIYTQGNCTNSGLTLDTVSFGPAPQ